MYRDGWRWDCTGTGGEGVHRDGWRGGGWVERGCTGTGGEGVHRDGWRGGA